MVRRDAGRITRAARRERKSPQDRPEGRFSRPPEGSSDASTPEAAKRRSYVSPFYESKYWGPGRTTIAGATDLNEPLPQPILNGRGLLSATILPFCPYGAEGHPPLSALQRLVNLGWLTCGPSPQA